MTITKAVIGALLARLLGAPNLAAQRANAPAADANIFARPTLVAHLRPHVLGDKVDGAISPDGRTYAYLEADQGLSRLMLRDLATGRTRLLAQRQSHWGIAWSPDSKRIAIHGSGEQDSTPSGIWVLDVDGSDARLVYAESPNDIAFDFVWMRDGRIVFSHFSDMDGTILLSVVDPATGRSRLLSGERTVMREVAGVCTPCASERRTVVSACVSWHPALSRRTSGTDAGSHERSIGPAVPQRRVGICHDVE